MAQIACQNEAGWLRHNALLGSREDVLDVARVLLKLQEHRHELIRLV